MKALRHWLVQINVFDQLLSCSLASALSSRMGDQGTYLFSLFSMPIDMYVFYGRLKILWSFGIFPRFGKLCQEKSGNPEDFSGIQLFWIIFFTSYNAIFA
jgi:hypothetical protein